MSEGSQVSKVTLCVKILKWQRLTEVRYRAARAAKNLFQLAFLAPLKLVIVSALIPSEISLALLNVS